MRRTFGNIKAVGFYLAVPGFAEGIQNPAFIAYRPIPAGESIQYLPRAAAEHLPPETEIRVRLVRRPGTRGPNDLVAVILWRLPPYAAPAASLPPTPAGVEEQMNLARELLDGFRSQTTASEEKTVTVVGRPVAQKFIGLQVLAGMEELVVIERQDPQDTVAAILGTGAVNVQYFGGAEEAVQLKASLSPFSWIREVTAFSPENPRFTIWLEQVLRNIGVPEGSILNGISAFAAALEELAQAA